MGEFYDMLLLMEQDEGWLGGDPDGIAGRVIDQIAGQHQMLSPNEMTAKLTYLTKVVRSGYLSRDAQKRLRKLLNMLKLHQDPEVWMQVKSLEMMLGQV